MLKKLIDRVTHVVICVLVVDPEWRVLFCSCPKCRRVPA